MGKTEAEAELNQLKQVIEAVTEISKRAQGIDLHKAEMALQGNTGNPEALDNLERNLRNMRARILSELAGMVQSGIGRTVLHMDLPSKNPAWPSEEDSKHLKELEQKWGVDANPKGKE